MESLLTIQGIRTTTTEVTTPEATRETATIRAGEQIDVISACRVGDHETQFFGMNFCEFTLPNNAFMIVRAR